MGQGYFFFHVSTWIVFIAYNNMSCTLHTSETCFLDAVIAWIHNWSIGTIQLTNRTFFFSQMNQELCSFVATWFCGFFNFNMAQMADLGPANVVTHMGKNDVGPMLANWVSFLWNYPAVTRRKNNVIMMSKWRRFDVMMTLLRRVPAGYTPDTLSQTRSQLGNSFRSYTHLIQQTLWHFFLGVMSTHSIHRKEPPVHPIMFPNSQPVCYFLVPHQGTIVQDVSTAPLQH